jgi:hypothetical protein
MNRADFFTLWLVNGQGFLSVPTKEFQYDKHNVEVQHNYKN